MNEYGLYPVLLLAGFLGSLVFIAAQDGPPATWWPIFSPIVAGTVTANYLAHFALGLYFNDVISTGAPAGAGAFLIGVGGPFVARAVVRKAKVLTFNGNGKGKLP